MDNKKFLAQVNATAYLPPLTPEEKEADKEARKPKRHRLVKKAEELCDTELLAELLSGVRTLVSGYAVKRTELGWVLRATASKSVDHTVTLDLAACSCEDCRFRERECKHIRLLRSFLGKENDHGREATETADARPTAGQA